MIIRTRLSALSLRWHTWDAIKESKHLTIGPRTRQRWVELTLVLHNEKKSINVLDLRTSLRRRVMTGWIESWDEIKLIFFVITFWGFPHTIRHFGLFWWINRNWGFFILPFSRRVEEWVISDHSFLSLIGRVHYSLILSCFLEHILRLISNDRRHHLQRDYEYKYILGIPKHVYFRCKASRFSQT